ncbi:DMT family transporter [Anaerolentibacter hominis]|uniref:DMT family transporter n=1 Tax=Anaerolentibacter hominis TaxID=3079009 RepID=UPI0031B7FD26
MWGILLALLSGALMSIQGVFNTEVTKQSGIWFAAGFVQLTAFIVCAIAWFVTGREGNVGNLIQMDKKYALLGGVIGAFITFTVIRAISGLGPAKAAVLIVSAQIIIAYVIELLGLFGQEKSPFEFRSVIGLALVIAGIAFFRWK